MKLIDAINSGKYNTIAKRETVTDLIPMSEVEKWNKGDYITIAAPTGRGKSHFIKHSLLKFAKTKNEKILLLQPRALTKKQFITEIDELQKKYGFGANNIEIATYQIFEDEKYSKAINFDEFDYIVVDEFHYFLNDASFNENTDISLKKILDLKDKKIIFMSATGDMMSKFLSNLTRIQNYLNKSGDLPSSIEIKHDYLMNEDYSFINQVVFYKSDDAMVRQAANIISNNMKAIFFFASVQKAYEMHEQFKEHSLFACSKQNAFHKKMDNEKIEEMLEKQRFECNILFTTTVMDTGLNIVDPDLNFILVDVLDTNSLIQCIGRKRNPKKLNLMIKNQSAHTMGQRKGKLSSELDKARYLKDNDQIDFLIKYPRPKNLDLIYLDSDSKLKINSVRYVSFLNQLVEVDGILNRVEKERYAHHIVDTLNLKPDRYAIIETKHSELDTLLFEWVDKEMLFKEDRIPLIRALDLKINGRILKTAKTINSALEELNVKYRIEEIKARRKIDGASKMCNIWVVKNID